MMSPEEYAALLDASVNELMLKTEAHELGWGLGKFARWDFNMDDGNLIFTNPDGTTATCPAQIIGTLDSESRTWLWSWANPSIDSPLARDAETVRKFGEENQIEQLTTPTWFANPEDAMKMTSLAARLNQSQGAYRGPAGPAYVYFTFSSVTLHKL